VQTDLGSLSGLSWFAEDFLRHRCSSSSQARDAAVSSTRFPIRPFRRVSHRFSVVFMGLFPGLAGNTDWVLVFVPKEKVDQAGHTPTRSGLLSTYCYQQ
jgi:hypothetical protein